MSLLNEISVTRRRFDEIEVDRRGVDHQLYVKHLRVGLSSVVPDVEANNEFARQRRDALREEASLLVRLFLPRY